MLVRVVVTAAVTMALAPLALCTVSPGIQPLQQLCEVPHSPSLTDEETERRLLAHMASEGVGPSLSAVFLGALLFPEPTRVYPYSLSECRTLGTWG